MTHIPTERLKELAEIYESGNSIHSVMGEIEEALRELLQRREADRRSGSMR